MSWQKSQSRLVVFSSSLLFSFQRFAVLRFVKKNKKIDMKNKLTAQEYKELVINVAIQISLF